MTRPDWAPSGVDLDRPTAARIYDYFLGGSHNFAADREVARQLQEQAPGAGEAARQNRSFLRRAVRYVSGQGITQFLDLGAGIPTVGNVHEIAERANPESTVVYVDSDPVAIAHSRTILSGNERATAVQADLRDPDAVLNHPDVAGLLDLSRPVALLLVAVVHFIPDSDDPAAFIERYWNALAPGSYLVYSSGVVKDAPEVAAATQSIYKRTTNQGIGRSPDEAAALIKGFELVEPGFVDVADWHPDSPEPPPALPSYFGVVGGVAIRR